MSTRRGTRDGSSGIDATETGEASKLLRLTSAARAVAADFAAGAAVFAANALTFAAGAASTIGQARSTSGAGRTLTIQPQRAADGSAAVGGTLAITAGEPDVIGTQAHGPIIVTAGTPIASTSSPVEFRTPAGALWAKLYSYFAALVLQGPVVGTAVTIGNASILIDAATTRFTVNGTGIGVFGGLSGQRPPPGTVAALTDSSGGTAEGTINPITDFATANDAVASLAAQNAELKAIVDNLVAGGQAFGFYGS